MLPIFLKIYLHFALNLLASVSFASISWLFYDANRQKRRLLELGKTFAFLLLALSFLLNSAALPGLTTTSNLLFNQISTLLLIIGLYILGFLFLFTSTPSKPTNSLFIPPLALLSLQAATTIGYLLSTFGFYKITYLGLEKHLKKLFKAFCILSFSSIISILANFLPNQYPLFYLLTKPFGIFWIIQTVLLGIALIFLISWIFSYLLKQIRTQMILILTSFTILVFLIVTAVFTGINTATNLTLHQTYLEKSVKLLSYLIDEQKIRLQAQTEVLAATPGLSDSLAPGQKDKILNLISYYKQSNPNVSLFITNKDLQLIYREDDPGKSTENLDRLVGMKTSKGSTTLAVSDSAVQPQITMRVVSPILSPEDSQVGYLIAIKSIDSNLFTNLELNTHLSSAAITADTIVATSPQFKSVLGLKITDKQILQQVLEQKQTYSGTISSLDQPYLAAFQPLLDADNSPLGMLFVGQPLTDTYQQIITSSQHTLFVSIGLILILIIPISTVSTFIHKQFI